jgi:hypothetical protein
MMDASEVPRMRPLCIVLLFALPPLAAAAQDGYRIPVQSQPYQRKCGTIATDVCKVPVTIPPGATGEQVYQMAKRSEANHNLGEALSYLEKSAELGYATSQGIIGMDYLNGSAEPKDPQKGIYWLDLAAKQGSRGAQAQLGVCYEDGVGVHPDQAKAIAYLKAAAAQHQFLAEHRLGLDYEFARGVPHNRPLAISLLHRATADGAQAVAGNTANFLSRTTVAQFHDAPQLDAAMAPPPPPPAEAGSCPVLSVYAAGPTAQAQINYFCLKHPGCPYNAPGAYGMHCSK